MAVVADRVSENAIRIFRKHFRRAENLSEDAYKLYQRHLKVKDKLFALSEKNLDLNEMIYDEESGTEKSVGSILLGMKFDNADFRYSSYEKLQMAIELSLKAILAIYGEDIETEQSYKTHSIGALLSFIETKTSFPQLSCLRELRPYCREITKWHTINYDPNPTPPQMKFSSASGIVNSILNDIMSDPFAGRYAISRY